MLTKSSGRRRRRKGGCSGLSSVSKRQVQVEGQLIVAYEETFAKRVMNGYTRGKCGIHLRTVA
jgi:hypothetical protein